MAIEFYAPEWTFAPPSPTESPEPPLANSLSIPDEAYGASGALALIEPGQELAPEFWDEADRANAARVDDLNNDFIERQREILHTGDGAFFNRTGHDALLAAPEVHAKLDALREEMLGRAANDVQRQWLKDTLDKHSVVEHFDIGSHAGRQSLEWQKAVNRRRLDNLNQQAALDHAIPGAVEALANASESSARDYARASGHRPDSPEAEAEVDVARSSVYRHAIDASFAKNQPRAALALYDKAKGSLGEQLTTEMKDIATDVEAEDWIRRQDGKLDAATAEAALTAPDLSPQAQRRAYQKVQAEIVGTENARVAKVEALDATLVQATKDLATDPSRYRRGTLATLAEGYASAEETDRAAMLRAQAEQESFLRGYAQSPVRAQQRILDTLPESEDRTLLLEIGKHQAEAFAKDPWAAGTSIYPDVGAPKPVGDPAGRMNQARLIGQHRDGIAVMPFSGDEIAMLRKTLPASPPERQAEVLKEMATLPPEILPRLAAELAGKNGSDDFPSRSLAAALSFHADGAPEIADQVLRGARLTQEKGDAGKPVTATTQAWKDTLRARLGDSASVPSIVGDTIANLYTYNVERAGQGGEIDTDLLDKAIITTKGNVASHPEIMLTPYAITPETLALRGDNAIPTRFGRDPQMPITPEGQQGVNEKPSPGDVILAQAPGGDNPTPGQIDEIIKKVFDKKLLSHPDFEAYMRELKKSPTFIRDLLEIYRHKGTFEFGNRAADGSYNKGTYFVPRWSFDKDGVQRDNPVMVIGPDQSWTKEKKADGTYLYPNEQPMPPVLQIIQWAHEVGHFLRQGGVANIFGKDVKSAAQAVARTLRAEGVAIWNEYSIAKEMGQATIHTGGSVNFEKIEGMVREGKADPQSIGELSRNEVTSTYRNLTYEQWAVVQWVLQRKLGKNWQEFDYGAIVMGKTLHIQDNGDGTYSIKGEVPYLPQKGRKTPPPERINEPRV